RRSTLTGRASVLTRPVTRLGGKKNPRLPGGRRGSLIPGQRSAGRFRLLLLLAGLLVVVAALAVGLVVLHLAALVVHRGGLGDGRRRQHRERTREAVQRHLAAKRV